MSTNNSALLENVVNLIFSNQPGQQNPISQILRTITQNPQLANNLLSFVMNLIQNNGGLAQVINKFANSGLLNEVNSWVSTGPNKPINQEHIQNVFGNQPVQNLATQTGVSNTDAASIIAKLLPEIINLLTPQGKIPENSNQLLTQALAGISTLSNTSIDNRGLGI